jgi:hypothetical protein
VFALLLSHHSDPKRVDADARRAQWDFIVKAIQVWERGGEKGIVSGVR